MNKSDKKSFLVHLDLLDCIEIMTDQEAGQMLRAIKAYWDDVDYELPRDLKFAFIPIKQAFDRDWSAYLVKAEANKQNGKKGGRPAKPTTVQQNPQQPKKPTGFTENPKNPDKDNDKDNDKDKDKDKDKDLMSDKSDDARKAIQYLNEQTNQNFRLVETNLKLLRDRLKSGATLLDIKSVVDKKKSEWQGTNMEKFLRPKTLFAATNFEQYLGEKQNGKDRIGNRSSNQQDDFIEGLKNLSRSGH